MKMNLENYYLDLKEIVSLNMDDKRYIQDAYREMLHSNFDGRSEMAKSLFNTLWSSGYLKEMRSEKIEKILS